MSRSGTHKKEKFEHNPKLFFFFSHTHTRTHRHTHTHSRKPRQHSVEVLPSHSKVEHSTNFSFFQSVLAVEVCSERQRFPGGSCWHTCECNKAHNSSTLEAVVVRPKLFQQKKKRKKAADATKHEQTQQAGGVRPLSCVPSQLKLLENVLT